MEPIGRITNEYSNYLALLAIDANHAATWTGPDKDGDGEYGRAIAAIGRKKWSYATPAGTGVLAEIGGCGTSDVYRIGAALVLVEHYPADADEAAQALLDFTIATHPTTKPVSLGTVDVKSGALALLSLIEKGPKKVDLARVKKAGVLKVPGGCVIAVKPGRYELWREKFKVRGAWGTIESRLRIVPAGTSVKVGAPLATLERPAAAPAVATSGVRRLVDKKLKWAAVSSFLVGKDGRAFAGERGARSVCAWKADGTQLWSRELAKTTKSDRYLAKVTLQMVGADLVAFPSHTTELHLLDPATGKSRKRIELPRWTFGCVASPDRKQLVVSVRGKTHVLAYASAKELATLDAPANSDAIAISEDGKWIAFGGSRVHIFDAAKRALVRSFGFKPIASALAFTPDGKLVIGAFEGSRVTVYERTSDKPVASLDAAPERARKPNITALATNDRYIAAARDDGTVVLFDRGAKHQIVRTFPGHLIKIPETSSTSIGQLAFSIDGKTLWVSAGLASEPVGLAGYSL